MFTLHLIHVVFWAETLLQVMYVLWLIDQLCLRFMHHLLFWEVMFILLDVILLLPEHIFLLPECIFLLPERIFLLTECLMGHLMGRLADVIMGRSMDRVIHLMGMSINNALILLIMDL